MTPTEIDSLRDAALDVLRDPRCRDLIAATRRGESEARSAYGRAKDIAPPLRELGTRFGLETWLTAMVARVAMGYDDAAPRARELVALLSAEVSA